MTPLLPPEDQTRLDQMRRELPDENLYPDNPVLYLLGLIADLVAVGEEPPERCCPTCESRKLAKAHDAMGWRCRDCRYTGPAATFQRRANHRALASHRQRRKDRRP